MKNKRISCYIAVFCVAALVIASAGCGGGSGRDRIIASIGNMKITVSDIVERIKNLPVKYQEFVKKRKEEFLDELINDTLLYQEALRKGLHKNREVQNILEEARKKILIAKLLKDEVDDTIEVSEEEVELYYGENKGKYMRPEIMRVSHILVPTKEEADKISAELTRGANFEDLARAKSVDPTAQRGGDVGYFPKGQLMPEFEAACENLAIGGVSGPVKTTLGYHIIKLTDRRAPEERPLEQVRDSIKSELRTAERQKKFNELVGKLRKTTPVKVNKEALSKAIEDGGKAVPGK